MTACEIIQETYEHYTRDPKRRSISPTTGSCKYNYEIPGEKLKHCAVGRCLSLKWRKQGNALGGNSKGIQDMIQENDWTRAHENNLVLDDMLMPRYKGHDDDLWEELQNWHDNDSHWDTENNRISTDGFGRYESMLRNWEGV